MKFSKSHEWVSLEEGIGTIGITAYAQKELGEVVYIELPKVGSEIRAGDEVCVLESTKAAADIYSPVSGIVTEVNHVLQSSCALLNQQPEGDGWLFKIELTHPQELNDLLDKQQYDQLVE